MFDFHWTLKVLLPGINPVTTLCSETFTTVVSFRGFIDKLAQYVAVPLPSVILKLKYYIFQFNLYFIIKYKYIKKY